MNTPFIYIRALKHAEHTVFGVQDGQKFYYDAQFGVSCAYSSGQQVKRSLIENLLENLNEKQSKVTFNYEVTDKIAKPKEPWSTCDPTYADQLLGGWMKARKAEGDSKDNVIKRRSPLSISAMRPLHPLLGGLEHPKENITFDRSSRPDIHPVIVKDSKGNILSEDQVTELIESSGKGIVRRTWIPDNTRAGGLFVSDIAIDLRTLFTVSSTTIEPELEMATRKKLSDLGWEEGENVFGKCLVCPPERRAMIIDALANAIIDWRITSNQARTFSFMETLAVAISTDASEIPSSIRAELSEERSRSAVPVLDRNTGADLFVTPVCNGYIAGAGGSNSALKEAKQKLKTMLAKYQYGVL